MKMTSKIEDYLETIYRLSMDMDTVGVTDVANARNVSVPTARNAVNRLQKLGFLHQKHYGKIILHESGRKTGKEIYRVHKSLRRFLREFLHVDHKTSEIEACRMEHGLSPETLRRLDRFMDALSKNEDFKNKFMTAFQESLAQDQESIIEEEDSDNLTLLDLKPGQTGIIKRIGGFGKLRHRILDLGLHIGESIAMIKTAPLRDPIEFSVNGNHISLRRAEAELVQINTDDE